VSGRFYAETPLRCRATHLSRRSVLVILALGGGGEEKEEKERRREGGEGKREGERRGEAQSRERVSRQIAAAAVSCRIVPFRGAVIGKIGAAGAERREPYVKSTTTTTK